MTRAEPPPAQHLRKRNGAIGPEDHISPALRATIRRGLLRWYDRHRRDLPWRRHNGNGYAQWVAEIMLQQTRVDTVIAYYDRFLRRFPSVGSLARADHNEVLKHWEGLGYYKRALHLHRGARQVVEQGGAVPSNTASLRGVPGIGAYTAAAIASIAFGQRAAAVDGNVARILARLFGVRDNVLSPTGKPSYQAVLDYFTACKALQGDLAKLLD